MEYLNNTLAVSFDDITNIICESTLMKYVQRGNVEKLQRGGNGRKALYAVESFPNKYKTLIYEQYPDLKERAEAKPLLSGAQRDEKAAMFYSEYTLADGRHLTQEKQEEYTANASLLNRCKQIMEESASQRGRQSKGKAKSGEFWAKVAVALEREKQSMPHSLPSNAQSLQRRFKEYLNGGYKALISRKFLNRNTAKVDDEEKESVIVELLSDRRNLDNAQVAKIYNMMAEKMSWKKITASCVAEWRKRFDLITYAGRRGETAFRNAKTMQVRRHRPMVAMQHWCADGWDCELLFQKTMTDSKGHSVTTYHNRLTVVVVLDTCINYPVGYAIGEGENPALIKAALADAVNHTAELWGQRQRAAQFQSDHYAIKALTPAYEAIADKFTPARAKNAKAKVVEPYFLRLNKDYCQMMPNWSGFGITSNKDCQPNNEAMNRTRHAFPDREGCTRQIAFIIEKEREKKIDRYMELYAMLEEDKKIYLSQEQYLLNFGENNPTTNALESSGINITIDGKKQHYDCWDMNFRKYSYIDWVIKYDRKDLSAALAVSKEGDLRFMLENKYDQPLALSERKEGDREQLQRVWDFNQQLEAHVTASLCAAQERTRRLFAENSGKIDATLSRLMLCDSDGQHKNQRNKQRLQEISTKEIEQEILKTQNTKPVDWQQVEEEEEVAIEDFY